MSRISKAVQNPSKAAQVLREKGIDYYVKFANLTNRSSQSGPVHSTFELLDEVHRFAEKQTDISDHLPVLFVEALKANPRLIVELGVRNGASTFALERVARHCNAHILSIDIEPCLVSSDYEKWRFEEADDIVFGEQFDTWSQQNGLPQSIDVLFIDTSHEYEHTVREIEVWFPHLADDSIVFFHDTNMKEVFERSDGSVGHGWDNKRGVIRAVEEYLNTTIDEDKLVWTIANGWIVKHFPNCSGLTILERASI